MATFQQWIDRATALADAHGRVGSATDHDLRRALLELHALFREAPLAIAAQYELLHERVLQSAADQASDRLLAGELSWTVAANAPEYAWALIIGAQLRALDWLLLPAAHASANLDDIGGWFVEDFDVFVIPRLWEPRAGKQGQGFAKRGLLHHRILPRIVGGHEVHLVQNDMQPTAARGGPLQLGAALFKNAKLEIRPETSGDDKAFVATGVNCKDASEQVARHLEGALEAGCFAVVWPELSVPPDLLRQITRKLARRSLRDSRPAPDVVVAGSWHEPEEKRHVNRARILDGHGNELTIYDKVIPFIDKDLGIENIRPGRRLPVVVTAGHLVGFAICKDFCDVAADSPFLKLHLDFVLVPSMGDEATMKGHQNTAKRVQATFGTRTFVVQQCDASLADRYGCGMVLPMLANPDSKTVFQMKQKTVWKSYQRPE